MSERALPPVIIYRGRVYRMTRRRSKPGQLKVYALASMTAVRPGSRVEVAFDLGPPPPGMPPPRYDVRRGNRGWVARLVHCTVEGEPIEGPSLSTIAHVRFDGHREVLAFAPELLRVIDNPRRLELLQGGKP